MSVSRLSLLVAVILCSGAVSLSCNELPSRPNLAEIRSCKPGEVAGTREPPLNLSGLKQTEWDRIEDVALGGWILVERSEAHELSLKIGGEEEGQRVQILRNEFLTNLSLDLSPDLDTPVNLEIRGNPRLHRDSLYSLKELPLPEESILNLQTEGECPGDGRALQNLSQLDGCRDVFGDLVIGAETADSSATAPSAVKVHGCVLLKDAQQIGRWPLLYVKQAHNCSWGGETIQIRNTSLPDRQVEQLYRSARPEWMRVVAQTACSFGDGPVESLEDTVGCLTVYGDLIIDESTDVSAQSDLTTTRITGSLYVLNTRLSQSIFLDLPTVGRTVTVRGNRLLPREQLELFRQIGTVAVVQDFGECNPAEPLNNTLELEGCAYIGGNLVIGPQTGDDLPVGNWSIEVSPLSLYLSLSPSQSKWLQIIRGCLRIVGSPVLQSLHFLADDVTVSRNDTDCFVVRGNERLDQKELDALRRIPGRDIQEDLNDCLLAAGPLRSLQQLTGCPKVSGDIVIDANTLLVGTQPSILEVRGCIRIVGSALSSTDFLQISAGFLKQQYTCRDGRKEMVIVRNNAYLKGLEPFEKLREMAVIPKELFVLEKDGDCRHLHNVPITDLSMLSACDRLTGHFRPAFPQPSDGYVLRLDLAGCLKLSATPLTNLDWLSGVQPVEGSCPDDGGQP